VFGDPLNSINNSRSLVSGVKFNKGYYPDDETYNILADKDETSPLTGDGGLTNNGRFSCEEIEIYKVWF
jgi:hypothetical protein